MVLRFEIIFWRFVLEEFFEEKTFNFPISRFPCADMTLKRTGAGTVMEVDSVETDQDRARLLRQIGAETIRGIAMYALGLPLSEVEVQAEVKSETVTAHLTKPRRWPDLEQLLLKDFPMIPPQNIQDLRTTVQKSIRHSKSAFQKRSARLSREFKKMTPTALKQFWDKVEDILHVY
jgi:hypothetical protein